MAKATIAIDIGGTKIAAMLIKEQQVLEKRRTDSVVHTNLAQLPDTLYKLCGDWITQADHLAIACTGQVRQNEVGFLSAKLSIPLQDLLTERFKLPLTIINDAAAAVYAEYYLLQKQQRFVNKAPNLVYITVSTGVGGGVIQNGQLVLADDGFCAHLGHLTVPMQQVTRRCHCGRLNCVEAIASGTAIAQQVAELSGRFVDCATLFTAHPLALETQLIVDRAATALVELIANSKAWSGCQYLILGGSVGQSDLLFNLVERKLEALPNIYRPQLLRPACGTDADLWGVYWYAMQLRQNHANHSL